MDCWWQKVFSKNPVIADCRYLIWYTETPTKWLENGTFFHCWRSVLVSLLCRMIITEGDGRHLFKTGRYWRRKPDQRFWNQIKLIAYNHNPTKRESGEARGTYIEGWRWQSQSILLHRASMSTIVTGKRWKKACWHYAVVIRAQCCHLLFIRSPMCEFHAWAIMETPKAAPRRPWIWFIAIFAGIFPH